MHFAVSNMAVMMTTQIERRRDAIPAIQSGRQRGGGQSPERKGRSPHCLSLGRGLGSGKAGWRSWAATSWRRRTRRSRSSKIIFPRYHQLDATRKLQAAVLAEGAGGKYLIQHSAGSGKTNSIAWSAHFLADLHNASNTKSCSIPCSLSRIATCWIPNCRTLSSTSSVRRAWSPPIKGESASKSGELAEALAGGKKIVVCTIQTFPFALKAVQELAATQGKRFAVIADEAHSLADRRGGGETESGAVARKNCRNWPTAARSAPKICWRRKWRRERRKRASPMSPSRPRRRQRRWSCSDAPQPAAARQRQQFARSRFTSIPCARRLRKASSSMF